MVSGVLTGGGLSAGGGETCLVFWVAAGFDAAGPATTLLMSVLVNKPVFIPVIEQLLCQYLGMEDWLMISVYQRGTYECPKNND